MLCEVCLLPSEGNHFGKNVCRPCAGFYRRTVVHELEYKCKANGKCSIVKELRKTCSFCRFEKCKAVGMSAQSIQLNRDKNGPLKRSQRSDIVSPEAVPKERSKSATPAEASPASDSASASFCTLSLSPSEIPLLEQLHEGVKNFMHGEKFLHYMMYPESAAQTSPKVYIKSEEWVRIERGCLPLLQALIGKWFPLYQQLSVDIKVEILRSYYYIWSPLYCCYLNFLYGDEENFVAHFGQYFLMDETFFDADENPKFSWLSIKDSCRRCTKLWTDMRTMEIREVELAAICAIGLANEIGIIFKNDIVASFRTKIHDELHADIATKYPANEVAPRICRLVLLLMNAEEISNIERESITMRKLVNNCIPDVFDDNCPL